MKKIFVFALMLISMIFILFGCSPEQTSTDNSTIYTVTFDSRGRDSGRQPTGTGRQSCPPA